MVEFAVVLPLLLVLSFGTIEIGLYLQRRIVLAGAAFVSARAAAVQGPQAATTARQVVMTYAQDSHAAWIEQAADTIKVDTDSDRLMRVRITRNGDAWTALLTGSVAMQGGSLAPIDQWTAEAPINQEFVPGGNAGKSAAHRPTDEMIDYQVEVPWQSWLPGLGSQLSSLGSLVPNLGPGLPGLGGADVLLAANPAVQAVAANPYDRHMAAGDASQSKVYVSARYEDTTSTNAAMLCSGFAALDAVVLALPAAQAAPGPTGQAVQTVASLFARVDSAIPGGFDGAATKVKSAESALFGPK